MCTEEITGVTFLGCWLQDPLIRLVMDSDHVSEHDMRALLQRVSVAVASRREASQLVEQH